MTGSAEQGPLRWSEMTSDQVGELTTPSLVGLVPVGAVEQHGAHLPTGTDTIIATAVCDEVSRRTGALVLPPLAVGCSYGHGTEIPGTLSMAPEQLAVAVRQWAEWAAESGLRKLLFLNAHMGNESALGAGTDHLRLFRPDIQVGFATWWNLSKDLQDDMLADGHDAHANRAETALMLHLAPHLVAQDLIEEADDTDRTDGLVFRYTASSLSARGVTGRPSEATLEFGRGLFERIVEALVARVRAAREEQPPFGRPPRPPFAGRRGKL